MTKLHQPILATKARTLAFLAGRLASARVLPAVSFTVAHWRESSASLTAAILAEPWGTRGLIVRSSAAAEDAAGRSQAGHFLTVMDVCGDEALRAAVEQVIASYGASPSLDDEVLVQPMLTDVTRSGVAFSSDPSTGAAYRVIEWVDGADTAAVTGGRNAQTYVHARRSPAAPSAALARVVALVEELESMFPGEPLDIEFAEAGAELFLLQVRPLSAPQAVDAEAHHALLEQIAAKVSDGMRPHPFLHGRRTIYGVMPDWNPAEIVGLRPRPLALSLYRDLITDAIWAYQRNNYGYKNLRSHPLLRHFHGLPYIDVRVSFNSFLPRDIEPALAERLVDHYLDSLEQRPELHDKVEFEIVHSCYTFDLPARLRGLEAHGFSSEDGAMLSASLKRLTNRIIHATTGLWRDDAARVRTLGERRMQLYAASPDAVSRIYWLLEDCKRYGTLPFCGLARAGFIAVEMLRSLVAVGVFSKDDHDRFINSLDTVSGQLAREVATLDRTTFLEKYGHLRPGTYDILSARYDEAPDTYFAWGVDRKACEAKAPFVLAADQARAIETLLDSHGLDSSVDELFTFIRAGIELRELSKFEFTRNLSDALLTFARFGESLGFTRDDLSYASMGAITELYGGSADPRWLLARSIEDGRRRYAQTCTVALPPLLTSERDVWSYASPASAPNFITQKRVTAPVSGASDRDRLQGAIACIRSADPGYDWVFSHQIAGIITAYGGANSHMAIRANELGLPAVIGAGEQAFRRWSTARQLAIDCANRKVEILG